MRRSRRCWRHPVAFAADVQRLAQQRAVFRCVSSAPAPMNIAMVNNHYRYKLTLKCRNDNAFRALMGEALAAYNAAGWPEKRPFIWISIRTQTFNT